MEPHETSFWQAPPVSDEQSSWDALIDEIFETMQIPFCDRARQYENVARVARLLHERRPNSMASTASTTSTSLSANRSTRVSIASSRTSYSSVSNTTAPGVPGLLLPPVTEETEFTGVPEVIPDSTSSTSNHALHRKLQKRLSPGSARSTSVSTASTPGADSEGSATLSNKSKWRWCPWCKKTFTRPHDFKKHVVKFCCGVDTFVCRNIDCREIVYQDRLAQEHRRDSQNVACRQNGFSKCELQCKRKHFGCGYCAVYFDDLDKFIEHFGQTCRQDKITGHYQQSRQIRALLQQPSLRPMVEGLSERFRGFPEAYKGLWWTWKTPKMSSVIRKLEYGLKARVDARNPGIPLDRLDEFIRDLIEPSAHSQWAGDIVDRTPPRSLSASYDKDLPPLPPADHQADKAEQMELADFDAAKLDMNGQPPQMTQLSRSVDPYRIPAVPTQPHPTMEMDEVVAGESLFPEITMSTDDAWSQYQWAEMTIDDRNEIPPENCWVDHELGHPMYQDMYQQDGHYMAEPGPSSYHGPGWHGAPGEYL